MTAKTIGIIPIRAGSKGLPDKNTRLLAGLPLFRHGIEAGRGAGITDFVVSTDIPSVKTMDLGPGVTVVDRPAHLAADDTPMAEVMCDLLTSDQFDDATVVLLQATSPLRRADDIRAALDRYRGGADDLVMSVCPANRGVLKYGTIADGRFTPMRDMAHVFSNRQALPPVYRPNGAVYVFGAAWFRQNKSFHTDRLGTIEMSEENSIDVDTLADLTLCEQRLAERMKAETK